MKVGVNKEERERRLKEQLTGGRLTNSEYTRQITEADPCHTKTGSISLSLSLPPLQLLIKTREQDKQPEGTLREPI